MTTASNRSMMGLIDVLYDQVDALRSATPENIEFLAMQSKSINESVSNVRSMYSMAIDTMRMADAGREFEGAVAKRLLGSAEPARAE